MLRGVCRSRTVHHDRRRSSPVGLASAMTSAGRSHPKERASCVRAIELAPTGTLRVGVLMVWQAIERGRARDGGRPAVRPAPEELGGPRLRAAAIKAICNPSPLCSLRLAAQDVALSRRKQGFESPRERQSPFVHFEFSSVFVFLPKLRASVWAGLFALCPSNFVTASVASRA
jgi:hypothetical protein